MTWLAVILGGALGSGARHAVNVWFHGSLPRPVPYATATVNLVGSFVIGALAGLLAGGRVHLSAEWRAFMVVGILGGFTTFSSFMLDTLTLAQGGDTATALSNVALQNAIGFALVFAGYRLALLFA